MFEISSLLGAGRAGEATALAAGLFRYAFGATPSEIQFTQDAYSLNSVSGRVRLDGGEVRFFKFHTEEDEADTVPEYYRGKLLEEAGLPVDVPIALSTVPGHQIALYELRTEPRMADVCLDLERAAEFTGAAAVLPPGLVRARRALDSSIGQAMLATLSSAPGRSSGAALHQLFHHRLVEPDGTFPGGRYLRWYQQSPRWTELADRRIVLRGIEYESTPRELAEAAYTLLEPHRLSDDPVVTAHGDDHQGNIWVLDGETSPRLSLFDAAFAADDIPVLLAPVKATFHNVFAHPYWLYHPGEVSRELRVSSDAKRLVVEPPGTKGLSPLRQVILDSVTELIWVPMIRRLASTGVLRPDWESVLRSALFCCPFLVTPLLGPPRTPDVEIYGLALAVMMGSPPVAGEDIVTLFFSRLRAAADVSD